MRITSNRPGAAANATIDYTSGTDQARSGTTNGSGALTFSPSVDVPGNFGGRGVTLAVTVGGANCAASYTVARNND